MRNDINQLAMISARVLFPTTMKAFGDRFLKNLERNTLSTQSISTIMSRHWSTPPPSPTTRMAEFSRGQIARVKPNLYRLPLELFMMVMDYLDFPEILYLCEDPEFPIEHLQRRHLVDKNNNSILFYIISRYWRYESATKTIIRILGNWDVPGGEDDIRPLNATIQKWGGYELCKIFVEAGARLDLAETTYQSGQAVAEYTRGLPHETTQKLYAIELATTNLNETPLEPLHMAVLKDNKDIVGLLLRHGANPNSPAGVLGTSLHLTRDREITKTLLEHGADINAKNGLGYTPLVNAISKWEPDLVDLLVEAGADVQLLYNENLSVLNIAIMMGSPRMVEALVDAKCDVKWTSRRRSSSAPICRTRPRRHTALPSRGRGGLSYTTQRSISTTCDKLPGDHR